MAGQRRGSRGGSLDRANTHVEAVLLDDNALGAATEDTKELNHVASTEIETTAAGGEVIRDERVTRQIKFPTLWPGREGLNPEEAPITRGQTGKAGSTGTT